MCHHQDACWWLGTQVANGSLHAIKGRAWVFTTRQVILDRVHLEARHNLRILRAQLGERTPLRGAEIELTESLVHAHVEPNLRGHNCSGMPRAHSRRADNRAQARRSRPPSESFRLGNAPLVQVDIGRAQIAASFVPAGASVADEEQPLAHAARAVAAS